MYVSRGDDSFSGDTEIDIIERGVRKLGPNFLHEYCKDWMSTIRYIIN